MSELAKHLPLSQRESVDESTVSNNWAAELSSVLLALAGILERMPQEHWNEPSARPGHTVSETAELLLWRLENSPTQRWVACAKQLPRHPFRPGIALERELRARTGGATSPEAAAGIIAALRARAGTDQAATIADLSAAVCAGLDVSHSVVHSARPHDLALSPRASGGVALRQLLRAPLPVRAAARPNTLVAIDAGWQLGRGPALEAKAEQILLFLFGRLERLPGR